MAVTTETSTPTTGRAGFFAGLYTGTGAFDIVGRRKACYIGFGLLVLVCLLSIVFRGFNLGIDFTGGSQVQFPTRVAGAPVTATSAGGVFAKAVGREADAVQTVGSGDSATVQLRAQTLSPTELVQLKQALFNTFKPLGPNGQPTQDVISDTAVSGTWGGEITRQALIALVVFLVLVALFIAFYFERSMAVAALAALVHDVVVTAGVYSIVGFEVTPATVIGLLTILGFSLYDTVVVFDKVKENARGLLGLTRRTYAETANLALNQTLMRSINTSLIAVLPVIGLMVVGVGLLGVGTLADLALVQLVGILAGALSSILLATPLLVDLKMRDRRFQEQADRVLARRAKRAATLSVSDEVDLSDDDALHTELRRERAMAAAASAPARQNRATDRRNARPARPTGKRRR